MNAYAAPWTISPIACLRDNYAYLIAARDSDDAWIVDPSEVAPVEKALEGRRLRGILATHHHPDHVDGVLGLLAARTGQDVWVAGHSSDRGRIPGQTIFVEASRGAYAPSGLAISGRPLLARHIPAHTRGAIAWTLTDEDGTPTDVFTGDTLFAAGCGRLMEGTPADMAQSLAALTSLPAETRLWFGHEYTAANLRFAAVAEPDNAAVKTRASGLAAVTTPTTVRDELATNPFVRARSVDELGARRSAKDVFKG